MRAKTLYSHTLKNLWPSAKILHTHNTMAKQTKD